jgi:cytochrome c oxidase subunit 3
MKEMQYNTIGAAELPAQPMSVNPKKFLVWLINISITMMFAGWTSSYIVARAEGDSLGISALPAPFTISTVLILLSSVTMYLATRSAKHNNIGQLKIFLFLTLGLGLGFLYTQWLAFGAYADMDIYFAGSTAVQGLNYVMPIAHGAHIVFALVILTILIVRAFRYKIHSRNMNALEMGATFWHFLDALWLYLFLFLTFAL